MKTKRAPARPFLVAALLAALALFSPPAPAEVLPNANDLPDLPELPELTPTPGTIPLPELPSVSVPVDFYVAREALWGSILGNDQQDAALVQALDGVRVVLSGLRKIDGKKQLYVGIDEQQFAKHNIEHIRTVLETRFPTIPIYIEATAEITRLSANANADEVVTDLFADDFTDLSAWQRALSFSTGWAVAAFADSLPNESATDNAVALATATSCGGGCAITSAPLALAGYDRATLSFHRWIDDALRTDDYLKVEVGVNGTYHELKVYTTGSGTWQHGTYPLDRTHLTDATTIRFTARIGGGSPSSLFDLFAGSESSEEDRTIAIDNVVVQATGAAPPQPVSDQEAPETPASLTIQGVTISTTTIKEGERFSVRTTIANNTDTAITNKQVRLYQTTGRTTTPTTGVQRASRTTNNIPAGATRTITLTSNAPTVQQQTTYYYYLCIDTTCASPVTLVVQDKPTETPVGPYTPHPSMTGTNRPMGGDWIVRYGEDSYLDATLTLGGVETTAGQKGFIGSGHAFFPAGVNTFADNATHPDRTNVRVHRVRDVPGELRTPLIGRVAAIPQLIGSNAVNVDATFVAYPRTPTAGCALEWTDKATREKFCLDFGTDNQIERVQPLKIRGKGEEVYTVIGTQEPVESLKVWTSGARSRKSKGRDTLEGTISSYGKLLASSFTGNSFKYLVEMDEHEPVDGDSGGPVYTVPDTNGRVRVLGVVSGSGPGFMTFSSWYDVEKAYNLKPIQ